MWLQRGGNRAGDGGQAVARQSRRRWLLSGRALAGLLLLAGAVAPARATTILSISFAELCSRAPFIFEGRVTDVSAYRDPESQLIWTRVSFAVVERIHGELDAPSVALDFLGGRFDGQQLAVTGMRVPALGEAGIYFVASLSQRQPHPLIGWSQGHYTISPGTSEVATAAGRRIVGIDPPSATRPAGFSAGRAAGIRVADASMDALQSLSLDAFKTRIRTTLAAPAARSAQ